MGLTVSDAMRMLLTRGANEEALPPVDPVAYDAWFRAKVKEAMEDKRPPLADADVEAHFANRRARALRNAEKGSA